MITFEKACSLIESLSFPLKTERIELMQSLNRVLAENICSDINVPPFDKSAMDGFACRKDDLANILEIIEEIPAGKVPQKAIGINHCARIMTGGMVPVGADTVVQLEHSEVVRPGYVKCFSRTNSTNICLTGEDIKSGEKVLCEGDTITPRQIAILSMAGITRPLVYSVVPLAVISTGNELVEPDTIPEKSQIRNSNGWQLMAQAVQQGYNPSYLGIVRDDEDALAATISKSMEEYNIILISGGVSVGDYDFVPKVLKQLGAEIIFHGLNAKPGKHMLFGRRENVLIFGLPGNPVSSFVQFEVLVKPLLLRLKGITKKQQTHQIPLADDYHRKNASPLSFIPGIYTNEGTVTQVEYHGSAHIHAYSHAGCIIELPQGITLFKKGDLVNVRSL